MKIESILELSTELDERGVSLHIFNVSDTMWGVHLYAYDDPVICFVAEGDDLRKVIAQVFSEWDQAKQDTID